MTRPAVLLEVPITFEVGDEVTHAPMVVGRVGGVTTKLILDTGSSDHVLTRDLADRAGLSASPGEPGTDGTGALVPSWTIGEATVQITDREFQLADVVAIEGPPPFAGWGVGGFLSPQHLHPTAWIVLDLAAGWLILLDGEEGDVEAWLVARSQAFELSRLGRVAGDPTILIKAAIAPFDPVVALLDTGGKATGFATGAVPGLAGPQVTGGHGVGGGQVRGSAVGGRTLLAGGVRLSVASVLVREPIDGPDGLIGMDVLRGTVVTVSADQTRPVFWQVPSRAA